MLGDCLLFQASLAFQLAALLLWHGPGRCAGLYGLYGLPSKLAASFDSAVCVLIQLFAAAVLE